METTMEAPKTMGHERRAQAAVLSADDILSADDLRSELVEVPEWGGSVYVWSMTGEERESWRQSCTKMTKDRKGQVMVEPVMEKMQVKLLVRTLGDAEGNRLFKEGDEAKLAAKSSAALERLAEVAQRLSGIGEEDIEDLVGNSEGGPSDTFT